MSAIEKIVKSLDRLLSTKLTGADAIAFRYLAASKLLNALEKRKTQLKEDVLAFLTPDQAKRLDQTALAVERSETPSTIELFSGPHYHVCAQIKTGMSYVDMEELRKTLNISERRWNFAVTRATRRRAPSTVIQVLERGV